jgi:hypothetical protein
MAIMIPDRCPAGASVGEKNLFSIFQNLPDDYYVYYEPVIENRYPDFIIIGPDMGVLIVEVKGWRPNNLIGGNNNSLIIKNDQGQSESQGHPFSRAEKYMSSLVSRLREIPRGDQLVNNDGNPENRFVFPFGHFLVLSNITLEQLSKGSEGDLRHLFPSNKVLTRDKLLTWKELPLGESTLLVNELKQFFDSFWQIDPLDGEKIGILRAAIHPEVWIDETVNKGNGKIIDATAFQIKVLDAKQEQNARSIGSGHRIVYGVAGSGKTILLISKAKFISEQQPDKKILFVCYNVALSIYLKKVLSEFININVVHFDGLTKIYNVVRENKNGKTEENESLGGRFLNFLNEKKGSHRNYDIVLVDEAQDFDPSWYSCLLELIKDPDDGDFVIVGDGSQGIYGNKGIVWKDVGIKAIGRAVSKKFDLNKNYRNTKEILEVAKIFSSKSSDQDSENTVVAIEVDPDLCLRHGLQPYLLETKSLAEETQEVLKVVKDLLSGNWFGNKIDPLHPHEIGIFYSHILKNERLAMVNFEKSLATLAPAIWINKDSESRKKIAEPAIKIQTIHSSKGLQYKAVIFYRAGRMPRTFDNIDLTQERKLMYVALTRAENYLLMTTSGSSSSFIDEIKASRKVEIVKRS